MSQNTQIGNDVCVCVYVKREERNKETERLYTSIVWRSQSDY